MNMKIRCTMCENTFKNNKAFVKLDKLTDEQLNKLYCEQQAAKEAK